MQDQDRNPHRTGDPRRNAGWVVPIVALCLSFVAASIGWHGSTGSVSDRRSSGRAARKAVREVREALPEDVDILRAEFPGYVLPLERDRLAGPLAAAIDANDEAEALRLLGRGADADWSGPHYSRRSDARAPLFRAIKAGNPRIVEALLQRGARVGGPTPAAALISRNQFSQTPLYIAVRCGRREIVDLLLAHGALISFTNGYGKTPIVGAVENDDLAMFEHLLAAGAECDFESAFSSDRLSGPGVVYRPTDDYGTPPFSDDCGRNCSLIELARRSDNAELRRVVDERFQAAAAERPELRAEVAVRLDDVNELRRLIAEGYVPTSYEHDHPDRGTLRDLAAATNSVDCVELLRQAGVEQTHFPEKNSALRILVVAGRVDELKQRLERGETFERQEASVASPLTLAVDAQQAEMVRCLLMRPEADAEWLADPLLLPAALPYISNNHGRHRSAAICLTVLEAGAAIRSSPVNEIQPNDNPLVRAAAAGWLEVYRFLADREPELADHSQALQVAAYGNQTAICAYLLKQGADSDSRSLPYRKSPLEYALFHRNATLLQLLLDAGATKVYPEQFNVSAGYNNFEYYAHPLYHAALVGDTAFCQLLLDEFPAADVWQALKYEPYEYDNDTRYFNQGNPPLFAPVYGDHAETLRLLLAHASRRGSDGQPLLDINARNEHDSTALHEAVIHGSAKCVQLLLANGADVTIPRLPDERGRGNTPLHLATTSVIAAHTYERPQYGPSIDAIFPMLIAASMRRDQPGWLERRNGAGATALVTHARAGNRAVCRKLLALGADPNAVTETGSTPLVAAIDGHHSAHFVHESERQHRSRLCLDLVEAGAKFDGPTGPYEMNYHALGYRAGLFDFCDALTDRGVTPDIDAHAGEYLCSTVRYRRLDLLKYWLAAGADANAPDPRRNRPLHLAVSEHDVEACRLLLSHDADPNLQNENGQTALFCAFHRFLNHVSRFATSDPQAAESKALQVVELLLQAGADPQIEWNNHGPVLKAFNNMPEDIRQLIESKLSGHRSDVGHQ
ncbi:MAG: ankyrin repeat domain-containing protein [Planctomycetota bacterium]|nr:ankyrin repeat domain-containing protein [Planctomycetota bacterium]